jgi:hypothetical protein
VAHSLEYAIRKIGENQEGMELNGAYHLFLSDVDLLGEDINTMKK